MNDKELAFLVKAIGVDGANALTKSMTKFPGISSIIIPRTILSWVELWSKIGFTGKIPGSDSEFVFKKSLKDGFDGHLTVQSRTYTFKNASLNHLAGYVGLAIEHTNWDENTVRTKELQKLGKAVDVLVKAEQVKLLARHNRPNKSTVLQLSKKVVDNYCAQCFQNYFENDKFVGCNCTKPLAKSISTVKTDSGYDLMCSGLSKDKLQDLQKFLSEKENKNWSGRTILHPDHHHELELQAATHQFGHKMPKEDAEKHAYETYIKIHREKAAAHHLKGMKAAQALGDLKTAAKHKAMYDLHLKALGHDPVAPVPKEVEAHSDLVHNKGRFTAHPADIFILPSR